MRARLFGSLAIVLGSLAAAAPARAQATPKVQRGFAVDRLDLSERGSEWFSVDSLDLRGKVRPAVGLSLVWNNQPLVAYDGNGNYVRSLVRNQVFLDPSASLVLYDRLRLSALVPIGLYESGSTVVTSSATFPPPSGRLGDIRLAADARLYGAYGDRFTIALGSALYAPTGTRESYTSDGNTRFAPRVLVAGDVSMFVYSARFGFHYRPLTERFDRIRLGSQLELAAAAGLRVAKKKLVLGPEAFASSVLHDQAFLKARSTPVELLFGAHYTAGDFRFGGAAGSGVIGVGSPAFRAVLSAEWAPAFKKQEPPPPPPPPPREPPPPPPVEPPPPPPPPPPPDRDGDGIPDDKDACPDLPGVASPETYVNGCPPDRDGDGVYDKDDACPDAPGAADPDPKKSGCPLARIEGDQIRIAEQVQFKSGSADILKDSDTVLLAIASTMKLHPDIEKVRVEGHTDSTGSAEGNKALSQKRAEAVVRALVKAGVDKKRLVAVGVGAGNPVDTNTTPEGRQRNRRVELHIAEHKAP